MPLSLIAAVSDNNCIGKKGRLPWHIPEDMQHFRDLTLGKPVLMGRKTWESIPDKFRPLPQRTNMVITRQADYPAPGGVERYAAIDEAIAAHPDEEIMIIGGADIYRQTIDRADRLYITHVHQIVDGDAFFPEINPQQWEPTERESRGNFEFVTYARI
ncbi:MAG: Dihydrofolate reductase [Candidatus Magasanikbacteria bacterium GW2011_GWA2_56_11]|uniref:Dihydrofolate reductase n=1 Tax=Candidatus Magasanikbacteria bacterium GW2011_GWA2_56_11 TaxID=1619044 RepID=A0A0G2BBH6_9BACT|nr:MAG: Dihydrofolate reductase [Candidatus Magasanikbacteria bacterium GW2011_GWA2_56_11]